MKTRTILTVTHDGRIKKDGGYIGYYRSLCNLFRDDIVYKEIYVEKTKYSHSYSQPITRLINNKRNVLSKLNDINFDYFIKNNTNCDKYSNYYEIITVDGDIYQIMASQMDKDIKKQIDDLLDSIKCGSDVSEKNLDYPPILKFDQDIYNQKLKYLIKIMGYVEHKKKSLLFKMMDKDCRYHIVDEKGIVVGKRNIKKYINSIAGFLNHRIQYFVSADLCGFINNDKSDLILEISYYSKILQDRIDKYAYFQLSPKGKINKIIVYSKDSIVAKRINDIGIEYLRLGIYNEYNEEIAFNIKSSNKTGGEILESLFPQKGTVTHFKDIKKN